MGGIALVLTAWSAGLLEYNPDTLGEETADLISGTERLTAFTCRKGETKHLILHGNEDLFSPKGEEGITEGPGRETHNNLLGLQGGFRTDRIYDQGGLDNFFVDNFTLPPKIVRGVFIARIQALGGGGNDSLNLQHSPSNNIVSYNMNKKPNENTGWKVNGQIISTHLDLNLSLQENNNPTNRTLIDLLSESQTPTKLSVVLGDDHMIDFVGFAVCTKPEFNKGITFQVSTLDSVKDLVKLSCGTPNTEKKCNPYTGNLSCSTELPLTCFNDLNKPLPSALLNSIDKQKWSGGEVKFTPPLRADQFATEDDAHAFCAAQFGKNWRTADMQDGYLHFGYVASGQVPPHVNEAWISARAQPYANCWKIRDNTTP